MLCQAVAARPASWRSASRCCPPHLLSYASDFVMSHVFRASPVPHVVWLPTINIETAGMCIDMLVVVYASQQQRLYIDTMEQKEQTVICQSSRH